MNLSIGQSVYWRDQFNVNYGTINGIVLLRRGRSHYNQPEYGYIMDSIVLDTDELAISRSVTIISANMICDKEDFEIYKGAPIPPSTKKEWSHPSQKDIEAKIPKN